MNAEATDLRNIDYELIILISAKIAFIPIRLSFYRSLSHFKFFRKRHYSWDFAYRIFIYKQITFITFL